MTTTVAARHAQRVISAVVSGDAAKSAVVASWQRSSALHHLDPAERTAPKRLLDAELRQARDRLGQLIAAAQPSLDRLYHQVGGVGCCVMLADSQGIPVERRGAAGDDRTFREWGLWIGTVWSEQSEGTNGIGTCIVEERQVTIHREQHFLARNTLLSCMTAPIFDHEGRLAAALDVSSCRADLTEGFVGLIAGAVSDAARRIEAENFRLAFPEARFLIAPTADNSPAALVAIDNDDLVVGATRSARQQLGLTAEQMARPFPAADMPGGHGSSMDLSEAERSALQRALARASGNVSAAALSLGISRATMHRKLARYGIRRIH